MFKIHQIIALTIFTLLSNVTLAATGYISDDVYVYMHSGPSAKFRIVGSVVAGSQIEIIEKSADGKYTKIIDDKKRSAWVQSEFASTKVSLKVSYADLERKFNNLTQANNKLDQESSQYSQSNNQLKNKISTLTAELATAKREKTRIEAKLVGEEAEIQIKWLINGGILVVISILFGILVTFIPSGKKKTKGNWS